MPPDRPSRRSRDRYEGPTRKILVVDDEPDLEPLIRQRMRRQIRSGQYAFQFAGNGVEAVALLEQDKEIELVLDEQPGVLESAVIGVPHADFGETVLGLIVPASGVDPDLDAIAAAAASSLARFKHPRKLVVIDELPRNTMGKVQKNLLREKYNNLFVSVKPGYSESTRVYL